MINPIDTLSRYAQQALLYEVTIAPKPGLVDRFTNGAHHDMDFFSFIDSILALRPFFDEYARSGFYHQGTLTELFEKERTIGKIAEKSMLTATKGINTHKGANFSFAILLGATSYYMKKNKTTFPISAKDSHAILMLAAEMTQQAIKEDFNQIHQKKQRTHGEQLYLEKGITGVRGEAASGYPALREELLPYMRATKIEDTELFLLRSLIFLMSKIEDSNLIHRGGYDSWQQIKIETKKIHQQNLPKEVFYSELASYDELLTHRFLSPGGAADLLSLGIYFALLEGIL